MTAPRLPEPTSLEWAITEARRLGGDRKAAPLGLGDGSADVPGTLAASPLWSDEEWASELGLTAETRGAAPGSLYLNPYYAAASFVLSPEAALKRRQEDKVTEEYTDPATLAASLNARGAQFAGTWPRLTAELVAEAQEAATPSGFADLSIIKTGY